MKHTPPNTPPNNVMTNDGVGADTSYLISSLMKYLVQRKIQTAKKMEVEPGMELSTSRFSRTFLGSWGSGKSGACCYQAAAPPPPFQTSQLSCLSPVNYTRGQFSRPLVPQLQSQRTTVFNFRLPLILGLFSQLPATHIPVRQSINKTSPLPPPLSIWAPS